MNYYGMAMYKTVIIFAFIYVSLHVCAGENVLRFNQLTVKDGLAQNGILGITEDKYGFMWFGTWNGLCRYDGYNFTIYQPDPNDSGSLINNRIISVYKDSLEDIWISFSNSIYLCRYNYEQDNFSRFLYTDVKKYIVDSLKRYKPLVHSTVQAENYSWQITSSDRRLVQINKSNHTRFVYIPDPLDPWSINDEYLTELYLDNNRILWVGTMSNGVNKADTRQKTFSLYYRGNNKIVLNDVRAICTDNEKNIWIGTRDNGYIKINRSADEYIHYEHYSNTDQMDFNFNQVRKIYCDRYGIIWIGTKAGLRKFDPRNNTFKDYTTYSKSPIPHNWVFEIMEDHNGFLLIGTFWGIAKYDRNDDRFFEFPSQSTLAGSKVRAILEDQKYNLWVATEEGGLICLKRDTSDGMEEKFSPVRFMQDTNNIHSISSNYVFSIDEDENGLIWIGTPNGLNFFDPGSGKFNCISINEGLPDRMVAGVICDRNGHVWASHKKGISKVNIKSMKLTSYSHEDGLQDIEFSENACYRNEETGELFFGGIHGFNSFYPEEIKENPYVPKVYITGLQIQNKKININQSFNGRVVLSKPIYLTDEITFIHHDRTIGLEFAGLHFSNPNGNKYKYMLEGFDKEWIETDASNRTAYYSNLNAGSYKFIVVAANSDGIWNPQPAILNIKVLPPWWKSVWAKVIYVLMILTLCFIIFRIIVARQQYKHQIEYEKLKAKKIAEFDDMKSRFFTNIAHELRTPLSLIIDPLEKIINDKLSISGTRNYFLTIHRNARRLYQLTNQLLDFRKMETGNLQLHQTANELVSQIKKVASSFDIQALQRNIKYTFNSRKEKVLFSYDLNKMETILYNLISNSFKYTPDNGEISIELLIEDSQSDNLKNSFLEISIKDNGIGIKQESLSNIFEMFYHEHHDFQQNDKSYGIGLAFTKELVELHGGTITVESKVDEGSCFKIRFPYCPVPIEDMKNNKLKPIAVKNDKGLTDKTEHENLANKTSIIIIEDNEEIRKYLATELAQNFLIYESSNGTDGFEKAIEHLPDLIISDIMMPAMDGIELCKKLKTDERTSHIPVILLSARQSEEHMIEGFETGADAYITKPFSTAILISRINNLIESRQKLREMFGKDLFVDTKAIANNVTDEAFIKKVIKIINDNLSDTGFTSDTLSAKLKMSRALLYKKIKSLTDMSVHNFIMAIRMNKATEFLLSNEYTISEVAYKVGFTVVGNFSRSFVKQFGLTPTKFIEKHKNNRNNTSTI